MLSIVVVTSSVFSLSVNVRVGKVRIAVALYQLRLEFAMSVGQVNDKNASVGCLVVTMVAVEEPCLVGTLVRPEILKVLAHHMLPMTGVIKGDLLTNATDESRGAVGGTVFAVGRRSSAAPTVGWRGGGG